MGKWNHNFSEPNTTHYAVSLPSSGKLLKTFKEKEKVLINIFSSFSPTKLLYSFKPWNHLLIQFCLSVWSSVKFCRLITLYLTVLTFNDLEKETFWQIIVGKGENPGNQHFLLLPQCFLPIQKQISILQSHLICHLKVLPVWTSLKNVFVWERVRVQW